MNTTGAQRHLRSSRSFNHLPAEPQVLNGEIVIRVHLDSAGENLFSLHEAIGLVERPSQIIHIGLILRFQPARRPGRCDSLFVFPHVAGAAAETGPGCCRC